MRLQIFSKDVAFKASFLGYIEEWRNIIAPTSDEDYFTAYKDLLEDYEGGIKQRLSWNNPEHLEINKPFVQFYWLIDDSNSIVGTIRYKTNVPTWQGNIGYEISPKHRNKGYGTIMLNELTQALKNRKAGSIALTVSKNNTYSIKVIEANNGVYAGTAHRPSNSEQLNVYEILL